MEIQTQGIQDGREEQFNRETHFDIPPRAWIEAILPALEPHLLHLNDLPRMLVDLLPMLILYEDVDATEKAAEEDLPTQIVSFISEFHRAMDMWLQDMLPEDWVSETGPVSPMTQDPQGKDPTDHVKKNIASTEIFKRQMEYLCKGLKGMPVVVQSFPKSCHPDSNLLRRWIWACLYTSKCYTESRQKWRQSAGTGYAEIPNLNPQHVPAYLVEVIIHVVEAGYTPENRWLKAYCAMCGSGLQRVTQSRTFARLALSFETVKVRLVKSRVL